MTMRVSYHLKRIQDGLQSLMSIKEVASHDQWTPEVLQAFQQQQLQCIVKHAVKHSPFYRKAFAHIDTYKPFLLEELPVLNKKTMMENYDEVVTDPRLKLSEIEDHLTNLKRDEFYLNKYRVLSTAGSSGLSGIFVYNRKEWVTILTAMQRAGRYMNVTPRLPNRLKICTIGANNPRHGTSRVPESMDFGLAVVKRINATESIDKLVGYLNEFQPEILFAYPSIGALLAIEQNEGNLRITPRVVVVSAEICTDDMKQKMETAWGVTPFDNYAMTEVPFFGVNCSHNNGVHIFEDMAILEVVDEHYRCVPNGTLGHKILITNLFSYTQPLIRYEITDMVRLSTNLCSCGRPFRLIDQIEGRCDDILELEGIESKSVRVHPLNFRSPLGAIHELRQYQVIHAKSGLHLNLVLREGRDSKMCALMVESIIKNKMESLAVKCPPIFIHFVDQIERDQHQIGKVKLIKRI
jgi:phenylacetate-CoA ligase